MTIEVLGLARGRIEPWIEPIAAHCRLSLVTPADDLDAALAGIGDPVRAIVTSGGMRVDRALLDRLPALGIVTVTGVGYDHVDVAACKSRGIFVCNAPGTTTACVADMAIGLYLAVVRRIVAHDRFVREGRWLAGRAPLTRRASGRRLGIWGLGAIGRAVARRALAFDMDVHHYSRRPRSDVGYTAHPSLLDLAAAVDVLVCTVPANAESIGAVNTAVLDALGRDGILVNVGRGTLVDEAALVRALVERRIAGAGLDVFVEEPCLPSAVVGLDNVVLGPHAAGSTHETWADVVGTILENVDLFVREGRVSTPVG